jgi:hypothetical protein
VAVTAGGRKSKKSEFKGQAMAKFHGWSVRYSRCSLHY